MENETTRTTKLEVNPNTSTYTTLAVVLGIVAVIGICFAVFGGDRNNILGDDTTPPVVNNTYNTPPADNNQPIIDTTPINDPMPPATDASVDTQTQ